MKATPVPLSPMLPRPSTALDRGAEQAGDAFFLFLLYSFRHCSTHPATSARVAGLGRPRALVGRAGGPREGMAGAPSRAESRGFGELIGVAEGARVGRQELVSSKEAGLAPRVAAISVRALCASPTQAAALWISFARTPFRPPARRLSTLRAPRP